jgi:hypothetical protein
LLAKVHYYQGQFAQARDLHAKALSLSQQQGDFTGEHWSLCIKQSFQDELMTWLERVNFLQAKFVIGQADVIRCFGAMARINLHRGELQQALEAAQMGLHLIKQKPFAGSWTMEGFAGVAETFLSLWEIGGEDQTSLKINAKEACQALHAFARIFPIALPRALLYQGWYDWTAGKRSQANHNWQKSLSLAEQLAMPYEQARTCYEIGRHLNDEAESKLYLQKASDICTELGIPGGQASL